VADTDSSPAAGEVKRLTPTEAALYIGASDMLTDRATRLVEDYEALTDEVAALRAEADAINTDLVSVMEDRNALRAENMDLHAQIGEWSAKYDLDVSALRAERAETLLDLNRQVEHARKLVAEVERVRPVVEAINAPQEPNYATWLLALASSANAYRGISHDA
jgi:regulator of replication initiation timing